MIQAINKFSRNLKYRTIQNRYSSDKKEKTVAEVINKKDFKPGKEECLVYLNSIFNAFQSLMSKKRIRNIDIMNHWRSYFNKNEFDKVNTFLIKLREHENFKQLDSYLLSNIHNYDSKQIAFITKTYNFINFETNKLSSKLEEYCFGNATKFDLFDINNILFMKYKNLTFRNDSFNHVFELFTEVNSKTVKLDIDKNCDEFENEMLKFDSGDSIWLKLNVLARYMGVIEAHKVQSVVKILLNQSLSLFQQDSKLYETNVLASLMCKLSLLSRIRDTNFNSRKYFQSFFKDRNLENWLMNLDLCYYQADLKNCFEFLNNRLSIERLEFLTRYFQDKIMNCKNDYLFFVYSNTFNYVLSRKGFKSNFSENLEDKLLHVYNLKYIPIEWQIPYFYFIENLNEDFKQILEMKYTQNINKMDGFTFGNLSSSLMLFFYTHSNPSKVMNQFYENLIFFYENTKPTDLLDFRRSILISLKYLVALSNENSKSNEIKVCSLLGFDSFYSEDVNVRTKSGLISFLMLNEETLLKNFKFINEKLTNDILIEHSMMLYKEIVHLLEKHLDCLLFNFKKDLIQILKILLKNRVDELLNTRVLIRSSISQMLLRYAIIRILRKIVNSELVDENDEIELFELINDIEMNLNENEIKDCIFNYDNKYWQIDNRLNGLVGILQFSTYYSEVTLNNIWNFLNESFAFILQNMSNNDDNFHSVAFNLIYVMRIYWKFDYTSTQDYLKTYKSFEALNEKVYNKILRENIKFDRLKMYVQSLISLNLCVPNAFADFLAQIKVKEFLITYLFR